MINESKFKLYSLGIVVETKHETSDIIKVVPIEEYSFINGKLADQKEIFKADYTDMQGTVKKMTVESSMVIEAIWVPLSNSNRMTAPDVVINESVMLFKYADTDKYYWTSIFKEPKLRRLETVLYSFSNLATDIAKKAFTKLSSYWMEVSTKKQHIWLKTTKSNNEPFEYDIKIDTLKGYIEIKDDIGNRIMLDSATSIVSIESNTKIILNSPIIELSASANIVLKAPTVINDANDVINTGSEHTAGASYANPHYKAIV
jgi:hypothetical protein